MPLLPAACPALRPFSLPGRAACTLALAAAPWAAYAAEDAAGATQSLPTVQVSAAAPAATEGKAGYLSTAPSASATGLALRPQDTPQPVQVLTRSLLDDQDAQTLRDVARLAPGLTVSRGQFYARGFAVSHWMVDGMAVSFDANFDLGQNLALYDRVEVVQGASGLMSGMGNPSAAINMVRKLPTAAPRVALEVDTGSWSDRRAMLDLSTPLNTARTLRARVVADAQNRHSFQDMVAARKRTYYGVVEADIAPQTTLRLGASQQRNHHRDSLSDIPTAPDGSDLHLPRSTSLGYDWEYWQQRTITTFAQLEHEWANGWHLRADMLRLRSDLEYLGTYLGYLPVSTPAPLLQSLGQYASRTQATSYALSLRGPWTWAGQQHQLAMGLNHRRGDLSGQGWTLPYAMGVINPFAPPDARQPPSPLALLQPFSYQYRQQLSTTQTGLWLATQLQLHDRLQLTLGGRWDHYRHDGRVQDNGPVARPRTDVRQQQHFSRYAGLVWKIDPRHNAYLQTSDIFQPRTERDTTGQVLPTTEGRTYGAGLQGQYLNQRLQAGLHLFQTTQRHAAEAEYSQATCPTYPGIPCFRSSDQVRSRGFTLQVQGRITPAWQLSASYTQTHSRYTDDARKQGQRFEPQLPRQQWQLATVYRLPDSGWRIGGSLYRQSAIASTGLDSGTRYTIRQPAYTLVGLMAAHQITPQWELQLNVRNLLDRRYYQSIDAPMLTSYGAPRSWHLSLRYQY